MLNSCLFLKVRNLTSHYKNITKILCRCICNNSSVKMESTKFNISERLSSLVRPTHYNLSLRPDLDSGLFEGTVKIDFTTKQDKSYLNLHSKFLEITSVKLYKGGEEIAVSKYLEIKQIEQLLISFDKNIDAGSYQIEIDFNGDLTKSFVGFYLSRLKDNRTMVASKFEPTYARQAFPCFDEPDFKATYDISLVKPLSYVALSNMNAIASKLDENGKSEVVTFATSVPMSTYLACFVVCDFDFKQTGIDTNGIGNSFILRSFAQKDQMHKIDFALDIGKRATEFYINYYEVPFPLPKLDMIAIPDYVSGATEHWGLITYRETSFLIDEATASSKNKISVANTVAHELAHMWFGNLVTMKWWDDLWLNEGFASYMQVKSLNAIEPSWTMMDQFLIKTMHSVLVTDAKLSSHPIVQTVATPDEITSIFDSISYNKGSSVLRMLEGFIGEDNFRRGVSDYLKKFKFGNTITKDLLTSLEPYFKKEYPNLSIFYIMDTWTRQMGYPLLTISKSDRPNQYVITQKRFLLDPEATYLNDTDFKYRWFVPITFTSNKGPSQEILWFPDTKESVHLKVEDGVNWLKLNNKQVGYYRVNYPLDMWQELIVQLKAKSEQLTISDRSHLLNDVFALAEARVVPYELALSLTAYLREEDDYVPWETAASIFHSLSDKLAHSLYGGLNVARVVPYELALSIPTYLHQVEDYVPWETGASIIHSLADKLAHSLSGSLNVYIQQLVKPLYEKQTWEKTNLDVSARLLRTRILSLATRSELPAAHEKVRELFLTWLNSHDSGNVVSIEPDLRDFVYYYGMKSATQQEWDKLWKIYLQEEDAQEMTRLRMALAAPRDTAILRQYLILAWDEKNIRSQDYLNVVGYISSNPSGTALVWDDVRTRWTELVERFSLNSRYLGNLIPTISSSFNTELKLKEMETFFAEYTEAGAGEGARRRALETIKNNIKWTDHNQAPILDWLKNHQQL